jgi:hypothetical protein
MGRACRKHGGNRHAYMTLAGKPEGKRPADLDVGGRIFLKCILEKLDRRVRTGFIWLGADIG